MSNKTVEGANFLELLDGASGPSPPPATSGELKTLSTHAPLKKRQTMSFNLLQKANADNLRHTGTVEDDVINLEKFHKLTAPVRSWSTLGNSIVEETDQPSFIDNNNNEIAPAQKDIGKQTKLTGLIRKLKMSTRSSRLNLISDEKTQPPKRISVYKMAKAAQRKALGRKFRVYAKFILLLLRSLKFHRLRVNKLLKTFKGEDLVGDKEETKDLLFNISYFKASKEASRRTLQKRPNARTEQELHFVTVMLRSYSSIAEYPVDIQKKISARGWYERYDARRILTREGHYPLCFYYILSGSVVVTTRNSLLGDSQKVTTLGRGESFGDISIINRTKREVSCISNSTVELLVLSVRDFTDIFLSGGLESASSSFLSNLNYLEGWPVHILPEHPKQALLTYFKRGTVMIKDSATSDWLFIVKSGSCTVLKRLQKSCPTLNSHHKKAVMKPLLEQRGEEFEDLLRRRSDGELAQLNQDPEMLRMVHDQELGIQLDSKVEQAMKRRYTVLPPIPEQPPSREGSPAPTKAPKSFNKSESPSRSKPFLNREKAKAEKLRKEKLRHSLNTPKRMDGPMVEDVFVMVETLSKGGVFGLIQTIAPSTVHPSFSLVSNGAECVMIHKQLFTRHMPAALTNKLRGELLLYPSEDLMQESLEVTMNWDRHKKMVLLGQVTLKENKKLRVMTF